MGCVVTVDVLEAEDEFEFNDEELSCAASRYRCLFSVTGKMEEDRMTPLLLLGIFMMNGEGSAVVSF